MICHRVAIFVVCASVLSGCGGRPAEPVAENRAHDSSLSCDHILSEAEVNADRILGLLGETELADEQNAMLLLAAPISIAFPFFLDLGDSERREIQALEKRNIRLKALGDEKGCVFPAPKG